MLIDKGYYDYDYTYVKPKKKVNIDIWSDEKVANLLRRAIIPGTNKRVFAKSEAEVAEELQRMAINDKK
jgi:hypothetical protein